MGFYEKLQEFDPVAWGTSGLAPAPCLDQFVIDTKTFEMKRKEHVPVIPVDMPNFNVDARYCKFSYFLGASQPKGWFPFRQIVKLDLDSFESLVYDIGNSQVELELMFVARAGAKSEDDGFVISIVHNAESKSARVL
eukprot:10617564-Ditylum_brightwellii.AAC.1